MPIRVLDAAVVGQIAAGEVVERPGSVVKELVENSLDAGATSITVEIRGGGIDYLRVTDNGCGIEPNQVRLAFENHATSKLQSAEQLNDIRTLGFRGEALPSIAAVSKVEMTTRARGQENGVRFNCEGGENATLREDGCPQGTTVIMRDLFFNVPVRHAFLKKPSYEGGLVSDTFAKLLLGNPAVSMRFISGGNTLYHSFGDGKLRNAVFAVYGRETAEAMKEIDVSEGGTRIFGMIGTGELAKSTRSHQLFYINGRSIRCPLLTRALEEVCRSRVTIGLYPMCVLNLVLPSTSVDINVHPNKLEVRFRDEETMQNVCIKLLESAFAGERVLDLDALAKQKTAIKTERTVHEIERGNRLITAVHTVEPLKFDRNASPVSSVLHEDASGKAVQWPIKTVQIGLRKNDGNQQTVHEQKTAFRPDLQEIEKECPKSEDKPLQMELTEISKPETTGSKLEYRIIGTVFKTYILIETGDMMLMIDQHAAHERLRYEKLMQRALEGTASQQLLVPEVIRLSAREMAVIEDNLGLLNDSGYIIELFGDNDIRVLAVPFVLGKAEMKPVFLDMLTNLFRLKSATVDTRRSEIMQMACKGAVKAGDTLSNDEIETLIREMLSTGAPATCPHGRPVVKSLSKRDLEKMFKRIQ